MRRVWKALPWAALIVGVQVMAAIGLSPEPDWMRAMIKWDAQGYIHVAENGYMTTDPPFDWSKGVSNVTYFPGYPISARLLRSLVPGVPAHVVLIALSQAAAVLFWAVFIAFLSSIGAPAAIIVAAVALVAAHPGTFFMLCPYSESVFLLASLVFLVTAFDDRRWPATTAAGVLASGTRVFGAALPLAFALARWVRRRPRPTPHDAAVMAAGFAGGAGFFAYCRARFGSWDLFFRAQENGWQIKPDWGVLLEKRAWWPAWGDVGLSWNTFDTNRLGSIITPIYLWLAVIFSLVCLRRPEKSGPGRALIFAAAGLAVLPVVALAGYELMSGTVRYLLPTHAFLVLGGLAVFRPWERRPRLVPVLLVFAGLFALGGGLLWTWLFRRYLNNMWVA